MDWLLALEDLGDIRVDELDPIAPVDVRDAQRERERGRVGGAERERDPEREGGYLSTRRSIPSLPLM